MRIGVALVALAIAAAAAYLGRRDLSRPAVVFGLSWFGFVALAQLHLTEVETDWSFSFAAATIGGGVTFMIAALAASGTAPARAAVTLDRDRYKIDRLVGIAVVLMLGATAGWVYKAHVLGGVPLLSGDPDAIRGRAFTGAGVPAWSSALTGGFYLAFWILLAAARMSWGSLGRLRRAALLALAAAALFGVALDASRNVMLLAVGVPAVAAYVLSAPAGRRQALLRAGVALLLVVAIVGGVFLARLAQGNAGDAGNRFIHRELDRRSVVLRPLIPLYVNGVLPLDGLQGLREAIPDYAPWGEGTYSLLSLPSRLFTHEKPLVGVIVSNQLAGRGAGFWTVASYQGRAFGDYGTAGVIGVSGLLGLLFGGAYRFARRRSGIFALVLIGYVAYYSAYLIYDNLLSFTLIGLYDLGVVLAAEGLGRWQIPERLRTRAATG
jgi:oligosaccharide repeat unit polymerase